MNTALYYKNMTLMLLQLKNESLLLILKITVILNKRKQNQSKL